jgi:peptidoglycan hydrolase CwlO-like protein
MELKEHKKVEEQQSKIENQQATIAELKSTVAQQQKSFESRLAEQHIQIGGSNIGSSKRERAARSEQSCAANRS